MLRAVAHNEDWAKARAAIEAVRRVDIQGAIVHYNVDIVSMAKRLISVAQRRLKATIESILVVGPFAGWGYSSAGGIHAQLHIIVNDQHQGQASSSNSQPANQGPLCEWNQRGTGSQFQLGLVLTELVTTARQWGRRLCDTCKGKLHCSLRTAAQRSGFLDI